jgi:hypothetical protein
LLRAGHYIDACRLVRQVHEGAFYMEFEERVAALAEGAQKEQEEFRRPLGV